MIDTCKHSKFIKYGFKGNRQRYRCSDCSATFLEWEKYTGLDQQNYQRMLDLLAEGHSYAAIAKKGICNKNTVTRKVKDIREEINYALVKNPYISMEGLSNRLLLDIRIIERVLKDAVVVF